MLQLRVGAALTAILRLLLLTFVWGTTFAVLFNLNVAQVNRSVGSELILAALLLMIPSAFVLSNRILKLRISPGEPVSTRDSLSTRELLAILNEEDLDDLRGEIRESLRFRIQRLSDSGGNSFEDLLAEVGPKRKRGSQ